MYFPKMVAVFVLVTLLSGCIKDESIQIAADGKATGSACRHAGRAIEDCFSLNPDALRSAVFEGWKEMNDYMRENKIAEVMPQHKPKSAETENHAQDSHAERTNVAAADHGEKAAGHEEVTTEEEAAPADTAHRKSPEQHH